MTGSCTFRRTPATLVPKVIYTNLDLAISIRFLLASATYGHGQIWAPICLPGICDTGFLHAYMHALTPKISISIVSTDPSSFAPLSRFCSRIARRLSGEYDTIHSATLALPISKEYVHLRHFIVKSAKSGVYVDSVREGAYTLLEHFAALLAYYSDIQPAHDTSKSKMSIVRHKDAVVAYQVCDYDLESR